MPTRKQRRRRDKTFRHEYGFVTYDEEGNEVEVEPSELRSEKPKAEKATATKGKGSTRGGRTLREPPQPSWRRSLRRGGMWGGLMIVVLAVLPIVHGSVASRLLIGILYAAAFIPLTYLIDRTVYRNYQRKQGN